MNFEPGEIYHVYNRGNNSQNIFFERLNYLYFLKKMSAHILNCADLLAWCLMKNHFHWMIRVKDDDQCRSETDKISTLNRDIATLLSSYTKAINRKYSRTGSLFQQKTRAIKLNSDKCADEYYPLICFNYIHQNPLKAKIVRHLNEYEFSSFSDYAGYRNGKLCNQSLATELLDLPESSKEFERMSYKMIPEHLSRSLT